MDYQALLKRFTHMSREIFGKNLIGIYLHGSAAMGCFNPTKSDLDLILVVAAPLTDDERKRFLQGLLALIPAAPAKGLELSIVLRSVCAPFVYPTPYEFHFSNSHLDLALRDPDAYIQKLRGTDKDLAAHFTIINHYGVTLYGEAREKVFGPVPRENYLDSLWYDIENAPGDILEDPVYVTLNLCRVLAFVREGLVLSKKAGGEWGLKNLPQYSGLISSALRAYAGGQLMPADPLAKDFAEKLLEMIQA